MVLQQKQNSDDESVASDDILEQAFPVESMPLQAVLMGCSFYKYFIS